MGGYRRADFDALWMAYCPGQHSTQPDLALPKCASVQVPISSAQVSGFRSVRDAVPLTSKNGNLSYSHAGLHACTLRKPENGAAHVFDHMNGDADARLCDHCGARATSANPLSPYDWQGRPDGIWLHPGCEEKANP
jgi:hypothetical protein